MTYMCNWLLSSQTPSEREVVDLMSRLDLVEYRRNGCESAGMITTVALVAFNSLVATMLVSHIIGAMILAGITGIALGEIAYRIHHSLLEQLLVKAKAEDLIFSQTLIQVPSSAPNRSVTQHQIDTWRDEAGLQNASYDFSFKVGDTSIWCHKDLLIKHVGTIKDLFADIRNANEETVTLPWDLSELFILFSYLYTGKIEAKNVAEMTQFLKICHRVDINR